MYGRLAWYRIASSESATAIAIPVRAVVTTTPMRAVIASRKSVRFHCVVAAQFSEIDEADDRGDDDGGQDDRSAGCGRAVPGRRPWPGSDRP